MDPSSPQQTPVGDPEKNWMAIISLVLIGVGLLFGGIFAFIPGIVFGYMGRESEKRDLAKVGFVVNIILTILSVLVVFAFILLFVVHMGRMH